MIILLANFVTHFRTHISFSEKILHFHFNKDLPYNSTNFENMTLSFPIFVTQYGI